MKRQNVHARAAGQSLLIDIDRKMGRNHTLGKTHTQRFGSFDYKIPEHSVGTMTPNIKQLKRDLRIKEECKNFDLF